uniref:Uncharacterized protein n=1 Tax=Arundo donax TaxID=35708 RepID=A0A0A9EZ21_ARUDO
MRVAKNWNRALLQKDYFDNLREKKTVTIQAKTRFTQEQEQSVQKRYKLLRKK